MNRRWSVALALAMSLAAIGLPIALAIREAHDQSYRIESDRAYRYARDVMSRADATALQALSAVRALQSSGNTPCSPASIELMRRLDLTSSYIQALGYVQGDSLVCSSLGNTTPIPMAPISWRSATGTIIRNSLAIGGKYQDNLRILQVDDIAAVIHLDLPINISTSEPGVALAVFQLESKIPVSARGFVDPHWIDRIGQLREASFIDDGHVVAVVRSKRFRTAAVAAIPVDYLNSRDSDLSQRLIPAGLLAGMVAAAAILLMARQHMSFSAALRSALKADEFFMLYQPVVDLGTGAWVGAEALIRWQSSTGELIGPDVFIPIAERKGLINRISEKVLALVLRDAGALLRARPDFHIAINLSASDFNSPHLADNILASLEASGVRPGSLLVEITERGLIDIHQARQMTRALQERGIEIAIDDFGTGYSSLAYLESLHLDFLKIDRSFIESIGTAAPISQVVPHIIDIAHSLSMRIIAEGIENQAQLDYVRGRGVQFAQGMLFSKPVPFNELAASLRARHAGSPA